MSNPSPFAFRSMIAHARSQRIPARLFSLVVAVGALAVSARLTLPVPGSSVPQSAQTLAVLLVGAWLGARDGALALVGYLVGGALGLPVFADGGSGWAHVVGPTGGFLVGFVLAAWIVGHARDRGWLHALASGVAVMLAAHATLLFLGWAWLARTLGAGEAFQAGVAPFLWGGVAKSILAAALGALALRRVPRLTPKS